MCCIDYIIIRFIFQLFLTILFLEGTLIFKKYLLEYDNDFVIIDINNSKIETLPLVN